jgi:hypothetical protein
VPLTVSAYPIIEHAGKLLTAAVTATWDNDWAAPTTSRASVVTERWPTGERDHFVRITPTFITGWRIGQAAKAAGE